LFSLSVEFLKVFRIIAMKSLRNTVDMMKVYEKKKALEVYLFPQPSGWPI
jgi:hypothetical protein